MKRYWISLLLIALLGVGIAQAQTSFNAPPESGRIFALSTVGGLSIGEKQNMPLPFGTVDVDWNPSDPTRWARIDNFGLLRFVPEGGIGEGVYTFAPYFDGYQSESGATNKLFMRDVEWSPNGEMLAFRIENNAVPDLNQGVWFWVPLFDMPSDPSYQILRHCPPFCSAAGVPENDAGWRSRGIEWSSDNDAILLTVYMNATARQALEIRYVRRDNNQTQAITGVTNPLYFEYGHWANDGQALVVSGLNPEGQSVFGTISRDGQVANITLAQDLSLAYTRDAVQLADGSFMMLASPVSATAPLQLYTGEGVALTPPIGDSAPSKVLWSPDRTAVIVWVGSSTYVALTNGTVYDITTLTDNSPNLDWVTGGLSGELLPVTLNTPIAEGVYMSEVTNQPLMGFEVGSLLVVSAGAVDIYAEPTADSAIVGTLVAPQELIVTSGPLLDASNVNWYRVQTLDYTGWIRATENLAMPQN